MAALAWILISGVAMTLIAMVGGVTLVLDERTMGRLLVPLVALAAGGLVGGALFHLLPAAVAQMGPGLAPWTWAVAGFVALFVLEQFVRWHHCHRPPSQHTAPVTWALLAAEVLHKFVAGLALGGVFVADIREGIVTFLAMGAHAVPEALGAFGVLVHGGWSRRAALLGNAMTAGGFLVGGLVAWSATHAVDTRFLVPFGAGNFLYIAAADLVPEVHKHPHFPRNLVHFVAFVIGVGLLLLPAWMGV